MSCPFLSSNVSNDPQFYRCVWPERLIIIADGQNGSFTQSWQVYTESWVRLPGDLEHWPQSVEMDGRPGAVVARDAAPAVRLPPGNHVTKGRWTWSARPESLQIEPQTALLELTIDGRRISQPERPDGAVWLGKRRNAEQPQRIEIQVYRLVQDEVPVRLVTLVRMQVSGDGREELLSRALPDGFVPVGLKSSLPARLDPAQANVVDAHRGERAGVRRDSAESARISGHEDCRSGFLQHEIRRHDIRMVSRSHQFAAPHALRDLIPHLGGYRALMFAWALWIVVALLRWLRSAWHAWKTNGIWRGKAAQPAAQTGATPL